MYPKSKNNKLNEKILITGANGFIGKNLVKLLKNKNIICVSSRKLKYRNSTKFIQLNLFDNKKVNEIIKKEKPKVLFHLAWETEPKRYINKKSNLKWYHSSMNLYHQFCKNGGEKAIIVGSGIELNFKNNKLSEKSANILKHNNLNYYNLTKILFHINSQKISNQFRSKLIWARVFFLYGPGEDKSRLVPSLINSIKLNKKFKINDPYKKLNILHVYDVAKILYRLLSFTKNSIVHVADNKNYSIISIVKKIKKITNNVHNSKITFSNKKKNISNYKVEIKNLKKINYNYHFDLESGLNDYINKMKN